MNVLKNVRICVMAPERLYTRIGTLTLRVPRHRDQPFHTLVFENYQRSETDLLVTLADMVVCGVSTRKVKHVVETLCGKSISKSSISKVCKVLDKDVKEFKNRRLSGFYPFVTLDAIYLKVRANHRIVSRALMVAYATNDAGRREIIGFDVYEEEFRRTWTDFLQGLKERGLVSPLMITSDAHKGMLHAIAKVYPLCPWQRCQFHFARNILDGVPKQYETAVSDKLRELFTCDTIGKARKKKEEIIEEYEPVAEKAMKCLDDGFESAMTVMILPNWIRKYFRTSNHLERLNREIKRRANIIGIFPNEESILRLIGSLLLELNDVKVVGKSIFSRKTLKKMITP